VSAEDPHPTSGSSNGAPLHGSLVHSTPGRLRVRLENGSASVEDPQPVLDSIEALRGMRTVRFSPTARSVTVSYDPARYSPATLIDAMQTLGLVVSETAPPARAATRDKTPPINRWVRGLASRADDRVLQVSGGATDLRTLLPAALALWAVREILAGRAGPAPWYTLCWWAFDSFLKLKRSPEPPDGAGA
jgi:hypothetical protein